MVKFTICKGVETLGGDYHLSATGFVFILSLCNLLGPMLCKGVILNGKKGQEKNGERGGLAYVTLP